MIELFWYPNQRNLILSLFEFYRMKSFIQIEFRSFFFIFLYLFYRPLCPRKHIVYYSNCSIGGGGDMWHVTCDIVTFTFFSLHMSQNVTKCHKMSQKWPRNDPETTPKWPRFDPKMTPIWPWSNPEMTPKRPRSDPEMTPRFDPDLTPKWPEMTPI